MYHSKQQPQTQTTMRYNNTTAQVKDMLATDYNPSHTPAHLAMYIVSMPLSARRACYVANTLPLGLSAGDVFTMADGVTIGTVVELYEPAPVIVTDLQGNRVDQEAPKRGWATVRMVGYQSRTFAHFFNNVGMSLCGRSGGGATGDNLEKLQQRPGYDVCPACAKELAKRPVLAASVESVTYERQPEPENRPATHYMEVEGLVVPVVVTEAVGDCYACVALGPEPTEQVGRWHKLAEGLHVSYSGRYDNQTGRYSFWQLSAGNAAPAYVSYVLRPVEEGLAPLPVIGPDLLQDLYNVSRLNPANENGRTLERLGLAYYRHGISRGFAVGAWLPTAKGAALLAMAA